MLTFHIQCTWIRDEPRMAVLGIRKVWLMSLLSPDLHWGHAIPVRRLMLREERGLGIIEAGVWLRLEAVEASRVRDRRVGRCHGVAEEDAKVNAEVEKGKRQTRQVSKSSKWTILFEEGKAHFVRICSPLLHSQLKHMPRMIDIRHFIYTILFSVFPCDVLPSHNGLVQRSIKTFAFYEFVAAQWRQSRFSSSLLTCPSDRSKTSAVPPYSQQTSSIISLYPGIGSKEWSGHKEIESFEFNHSCLDLAIAKG